ncbi:protein phosphatase 2C domain-containing protein [Massilia sp. METH4]|uniref:protein phosphatase 2C domain-containing protein n=1 Tax=Massilia sp. METH4 TaxID=3123041 RepID=UPI0030CEC34A
MNELNNPRIERVSQGASPGHNEDHVIVVETPAATDLIVLDGATSVADHDYIDPAGDVAWFVARFGAALEQAIHDGLDQEPAVLRAIGAVRDEYLGHAGGAEVPPYAWPIAAMTWVRAARDQALHLYCLGDCITLMTRPDGTVVDLDPYVNPQEAVLRAEIARLSAAGIDDPAARYARLLPLLRARREEQNGSANPAILCLRPAGALAARRHVVPAPGGSMLLVMTDGFYRLVDPYGLHTPISLMTACEQRGLAAALHALRGYEAEMAVGNSVKRADDASAILWRAPPV